MRNSYIYKTLLLVSLLCSHGFAKFSNKFDKQLNIASVHHKRLSSKKNKAQGNIIVINDYAYDSGKGPLGNVKYGFDIPAGTQVVWAVTGPAKVVDGPITWANQTSVLTLQEDLHLGEDGALVGGYWKANAINIAVIDGQGNTIFLGNDLTCTAIGALSDLTFDGSGDYAIIMDNSATVDGGLETSGAFWGFFADTTPELKLSNLSLKLSVDADNGYVFYPFNSFNRVFFDNAEVSVATLNGSYGYPLSCKVSAGFVVQNSSSLERSDSDAGVYLGSYHVSVPLSIKKNADFLVACPKLATIQLISMDDASAMMRLDSAALYSGDAGLAIYNGTLLYQGETTLYNGAIGSAPNTDPLNSFVLDKVSQFYAKNAAMSLHGYLQTSDQLYLGIHNDNVEVYANKLEIPSHGTVIWDSSAPITGSLAWSDESSILKLESDLNLAQGAVLISGEWSEAEEGIMMLDAHGNTIYLLGDVTLSSAYGKINNIIATSNVIIEGQGHAFVSDKSSSIACWGSDPDAFLLMDIVFIDQGGERCNMQRYVVAELDSDPVRKLLVIRKAA